MYENPYAIGFVYMFMYQTNNMHLHNIVYEYCKDGNE